MMRCHHNYFATISWMIVCYVILILFVIVPENNNGVVVGWTVVTKRSIIRRRFREKAWQSPTSFSSPFAPPARLPREVMMMSEQTTPIVEFDSEYYSVPPTLEHQPKGEQRITLTRFLSNIVKENPHLRDMQSLSYAVQMACKTISNLVNRAGLMSPTSNDNDNGDGFYYNITTSKEYSDGRFYSMKRLDQLSTTVLKNALHYTGKCDCVAPTAKFAAESPAEHQPGVLIANDIKSNYVAVLDPLDGSGNADASICTGTVFGVFEAPSSDNTNNNNNNNNNTGTASNSNTNNNEDDMIQAVLQPGKNMRAAGYCLYSSATVLVFTLEDLDGVYGFTLDQQIQDFVLTHRNLTIPKRGNVYSMNEANSEGWDDNFLQYLKNIKLGTGETQDKYAHRYVGSMVGDIHRTLLYGGIFCYPPDNADHPDGNLQLLYKTAPMAYIVTKAGGKAIDGRTGNLLDIKPQRVHQQTPCYIGSPEDIEEVEKYL